jgi:hypothetical protein
MPLVKMNLLKGRSAEEKDSIAASIQTALVSTLEVPDADRYQLFKSTTGRASVIPADQQAPTSQLAG